MTEGLVAGCSLYIPDTCLLICAAMFVEIDGGFFDCIEGNPIPPDGNFALFTGKLYGCVPMVFVTLIIIRIIDMFCHVFCPPFFGYLFRFDV
jgi:hypothetical protein